MKSKISEIWKKLFFAKKKRKYQKNEKENPKKT